MNKSTTKKTVFRKQMDKQSSRTIAAMKKETLTSKFYLGSHNKVRLEVFLIFYDSHKTKL